ncbi:BspA family leucine-rich repeat surface protein [Flavobacterium sp.]|uniref:BspA family leucine-rich repeat surface protein n=1 Tax=Flavobacterium sp. TaxID=239 RepID=UPI00286EA746|nr:BspA family leucine-rich repeat surface protein [Flavobacterium sp.]
MTKRFFSFIILIFFLETNCYGASFLGTIPFITTWKTDNPGTSNNNQIIIPTTGIGYNYTVDWGDGNTSIHTGDALHTYATPGTYTVSISGTFPQIYFNDKDDKKKIISINQWGDNPWRSMFEAFSGCSNLQGSFTDVPDLSNATSTDFMFNFATSFNYNIGNWDLSNVITMRGMFYGASLFNQDIGNWNVSRVDNMQDMFGFARSFNQDIGNWNVGKVTSMTGMFQSAAAFNQDIGDWNVSNVKEMNGMFNAAISFNQDIGKWNVSSVNNIGGMFDSAISFDQNLGNWDVRKISFFGNLFYDVTLSVANYDALLIGWDAQNLKLNATFDGGKSKYCAGAAARANMIAKDGWLITDGGSAGPTINDLLDTIDYGSFTLPTISGVNLLGNEAYYTGTSGTGTKFYAGQIINYSDFSSYPITLYIYGGTSMGCNSQQDFKLTITLLPSCTTLSSPASGALNVAVGTSLIWNAVPNASGYKLTVGTSSSATDILNAFDVGNNLIHNLPSNLPRGTTIYVQITPYNLNGDAITCSPEHFLTVTTAVNEDLPPTFFTPNNDGINDFWQVPNPLNTILTISIFNRYAKLLKQLEGNSGGWDGNYLGSPMLTDDYWYLIAYKDGSTTKGHFTLKR